MEKDNEAKGQGNHYTSEFRELDVRLGRWFTLDPVVHYMSSPYVCFDNNPIYFNDPSGADSEEPATENETDGTTTTNQDSPGKITEDHLVALLNPEVNKGTFTTLNKAIASIIMKKACKKIFTPAHPIIKGLQIIQTAGTITFAASKALGLIPLEKMTYQIDYSIKMEP